MRPAEFGRHLLGKEHRDAQQLSRPDRQGAPTQEGLGIRQRLEEGWLDIDDEQGQVRDGAFGHGTTLPESSPKSAAKRCPALPPMSQNVRGMGLPRPPA